MTTPNLNLPELAAGQAQPHLTINEALRMLDALAQVSCIAQQNTPPVSPVDGDRYLVDSAPTGTWTGQAQKIAAYIGTSWVFSTPQEGWLVWLRSAGALYIYSPDSPEEWAPLQTGAASPTTTLGDLIVRGASADQRLPVGSDTEVLTVVAGEPAWAAPTGGSVATDAIWTAQGQLVVGTGAGTAVVLDPPLYDPGVLSCDIAGNVTWEVLTPPAAVRYIHGFFSGIPGADQLIWAHQVATVMEFTISDMQAQARVPPADTAVVEIAVRVGGVHRGRILIDSSGYGYGVDDDTPPHTVSGGVTIEFVAPTIPDSMMEDISIVGFETV